MTNPPATALVAGVLSALMPLSAYGADDAYAWSNETSDSGTVLIYASTDASDDVLFILSCNNVDKSTGMTVLVEIAGTKVEDPVTIELAAGAAKHAVEGYIWTDELAGFNYADAKQIELKPVIAVLGEKGPVTVKAANMVTTFSDKARAAELASFVKGCSLD